MSIGNVRKGITQAQFNEENANIVYGEIAILSIITGFGFESWYIGGGVFLGLIIGMLLPYVSVIMAIIFSLFWAFIAGFIFLIFSTGAGIVVGIIVFLASIGIHVSAIEWGKDITDPEERNF